MTTGSINGEVVIDLQPDALVVNLDWCLEYQCALPMLAMPYQAKVFVQLGAYHHVAHNFAVSVGMHVMSGTRTARFFNRSCVYASGTWDGHPSSRSDTDMSLTGLVSRVRSGK